MQRGAVLTGLCLVEVSILIRPSGRMQRALVDAVVHHVGVVSILIRPEGRMQRSDEIASVVTNDVSILIRPEGRMQPGRRVGLSGILGVSILIRPEGRMQRDALGLWRPVVPVSILIRPEGRMQRVFREFAWATCCFNPHPAFWPDATTPGLLWSQHGRRVSILIRPEGRMQPGQQGQHHRLRGYVSILIRPEGRMQLVTATDPPPTLGNVSILIRPEGRMQPRRSECQRTIRAGFNPHPARRPDATRLCTDVAEQMLRVSILIRPEGRMQLLHQAHRCRTEIVSILIRPEGRMQPPGSQHQRAGRRTCFNPHPAFWPDATIRPAVLKFNLVVFQSSSGQKAGCNDEVGR